MGDRHEEVRAKYREYPHANRGQGRGRGGYDTSVVATGFRRDALDFEQVEDGFGVAALLDLSPCKIELEVRPPPLQPFGHGGGVDHGGALEHVERIARLGGCRGAMDGDVDGSETCPAVVRISTEVVGKAFGVGEPVPYFEPVDSSGGDDRGYLDQVPSDEANLGLDVTSSLQELVRVTVSFGSALALDVEVPGTPPDCSHEAIATTCPMARSV